MQVKMRRKSAGLQRCIVWPRVTHKIESAQKYQTHSAREPTLLAEVANALRIGVQRFRMVICTEEPLLTTFSRRNLLWPSLLPNHKKPKDLSHFESIHNLSLAAKVHHRSSCKVVVSLFAPRKMRFKEPNLRTHTDLTLAVERDHEVF